ncbi:MAG: hypothetical protein M3N53_13055 [Actinomycetota bacterium]|nr:hypothetical protein [Actinomycetota bacterium]
MGRINPSGKKLSLYDFNIHKMEDRWEGWVDYIKRGALLKPDIVLIQDFADRRQRELFLETLRKQLGGTWDGRGYAESWHPAVVWRKERFERARHRAWRGFGGPGCAADSDGSPAVQVRLFDRLAKRWVTCASFKTEPKAPPTRPLSNFTKANTAMLEPSWSGDLMIMGSDANESDRTGRGWSSWYSGVNVRLARGAQNLGYCDPVFEVCDGDPKLLKKHVTREGGNRIDYLLVKRRTGPVTVEQAGTLPAGDDAGRWSDHLSIHAVVAY